MGKENRQQRTGIFNGDGFPARPGGETGRRTGLKIPGLERDVSVQFRSRAPLPRVHLSLLTGRIGNFHCPDCQQVLAFLC